MYRYNSSNSKSQQQLNKNLISKSGLDFEKINNLMNKIQDNHQDQTTTNGTLRSGENSRKNNQRYNKQNSISSQFRIQKDNSNLSKVLQKNATQQNNTKNTLNNQQYSLKKNNQKCDSQKKNQTQQQQNIEQGNTQFKPRQFLNNQQESDQQDSPKNSDNNIGENQQDQDEINLSFDKQEGSQVFRFKDGNNTIQLDHIINDQNEEYQQNLAKMNKFFQEQSPMTRKEINLSQKNQFTKLDSRYNLIQKLSKNNDNLQDKIDDLNGELEEIDEFRIVLDQKDKSQDNFNEYRIKLLKSQIAKQQRYIKKLTNLLQTTRSSYKEIYEVCQYFLQGYEQSQKKSANYFQDDDKFLPQSFEGVQNKIEKRDYESSMKSVLSAFNTPQEREQFLVNYNSCFQKIHDYEQKNKVFQQLFIPNQDSEGVQQLMKKKILKYNQPIEKFLKQYGSYFNISTVFQSFPVSYRENIYNMVVSLQSQLKQVEKTQNQINTFEVFKHNPFVFKSQNQQFDLPQQLIDNTEALKNYFDQQEKFRTLYLDFNKIQQTESSLSTLLESLVNFQKDFQQANSHVMIGDVGDIVQLLRKSIEELLCLGILMGQDEGANTQKLILMQQELNQNSQSNLDSVDTQQNKQNDSHNTSQLSQNRQKNQQSSLNTALNEKEKKIQKENESQKYKYSQIIYDKNVDINSEFKKKNILLEQYIGDFSIYLYSKDYANAQQVGDKIIDFCSKFGYIYQMKNNILQLKDAEINFLRSQIRYYEQDIDQIQDFVKLMSKEMKQFLDPIGKHIQNIISQFDLLMATGKQKDPKTQKNFVINFKSSMKLILDSIYRLQNKECANNTINIKALQDEFNNKINLLSTKWNKIKNQRLNKL